MTPLRKRMLDAMVLRGFAQRTQETYLGAVIRMAQHYDCSPDRLSDEQVQAYLLHLLQERHPPLRGVSLKLQKAQTRCGAVGIADARHQRTGHRVGASLHGAGDQDGHIAVPVLQDWQAPCQCDAAKPGTVASAWRHRVQAQPGASVTLRLLPLHRFARRFATSGSMLGATLSTTFAGHTNGPAQAMTAAVLTDSGRWLQTLANSSPLRIKSLGLNKACNSLSPASVVAVQSNPVYLPPFSGCFFTGTATATDKRYSLSIVTAGGVTP